MISGKKDDDCSEPIKVYRPKKPNYYPEPPPDLYFYQPEPGNKRLTLYTAMSLLTFFLLYIGFCFHVRYFSHPAVPRLNFGYISLGSPHLLTNESLLSQLDFSLTNPNILFNVLSIMIRVEMIYKGQTMGVFMVPLLDIPPQNGYSIRAMPGKPLVTKNNFLFIKEMTEDQSRGMVHMVANTTLFALYDSRLTPFGSRNLAVLYTCEDMKANFSSSSEQGEFLGGHPCSIRHEKLKMNRKIMFKLIYQSEERVKRNRQLGNVILKSNHSVSISVGVGAGLWPFIFSVFLLWKSYLG